MTIDLLYHFAPDAEGLLHRIAEHVGDEMLKEISTADYGEDAEEHLRSAHDPRYGGATISLAMVSGRGAGTHPMVGAGGPNLETGTNWEKSDTRAPELRTFVALVGEEMLG